MRTTTAIANVPPACAQLWMPYHVTMVPPPDELAQEHVPPAPRVVNKTNGAVSDAEAQHWADANNWDSGWFKWAEANVQPGLLPFLVGPALISPTEEMALERGAAIEIPDCIFPVSASLYPTGDDGRAYFSSKHLPASDDYVLVITFQGSCSSTAVYPDGHKETIPQTSGVLVAFAPGVLRHDPVLGDIWFSDAGGNCQDPAGAPTEWCGR